MKIATFNIRCPFRGVDGINAFIHRFGGIVLAVDREAPDVLCFQEMRPEHLALLSRVFEREYEIVFTRREVKENSEGLAIFTKRDTVTREGEEVFWLSPTPDVPGSRYPEQSICPRICVRTDLRLRDTGEPFRVYNVHLDHESASARTLGMGLILSRVKADSATPSPAFILGDFNAQPDEEAVRLLTRAGLCDLTRDSGATFHAFGKPSPVKIDYIFTDEKTAKRAAPVTVWHDEEDGIYLSDHFPLSVVLS